MEPTLPILPHIERVLDAARIAPSRDNLQPWRFVLDGETISFFVDHERDRSPANIGGAMSRIAVGAALECALLRAARMGTTVRFETPRPGALVTIQVSNAKRDPEPDKALVRRVTNRKLYDARALDDATLAALHEATQPFEGVRTHWFGRGMARALGPILAEAESLFYGDPRLREGAMKAVRFDVRDREEVAHGMSLGCLELSPQERVAMDELRKSAQDRLTALGAYKKMGARAQRLVESASGVCVLSIHGSDPSGDVSVGRAMQRAWLALTRKGLVAQPMTAVTSLEAVLELGPAQNLHLAERERIADQVAAFRAAFPSVERSARIAFLLRFGWAAAPAARVARLPLEESVALAPPE